MNEAQTRLKDTSDRNLFHGDVLGMMADVIRKYKQNNEKDDNKSGIRTFWGISDLRSKVLSLDRTN